MSFLPVTKRFQSGFPSPFTIRSWTTQWALALMLFLFGHGAVAGTETEPTTRLEFGAPPTSSQTSTLEEVLPRVDFRLEASLSGLVFVDSGMSEAYSMVPVFRTGLTMDLGPQLQFLISAGYGSSTSDLEIDPTFEATHDLKLKLVPIQMGFRTNTTALNDFRVNLGLFFQAVWLEETAPYFQTYPYLDTGTSTDTGWGHQVQISLGPEWRLADDKWVIGAEALAGIGGGEVIGHRRRDISLDGFVGRLYCSIKLGSMQEGNRNQEVRP